MLGCTDVCCLMGQIFAMSLGNFSVGYFSVATEKFYKSHKNICHIKYQKTVHSSTKKKLPRNHNSVTRQFK